MLREPIFQAIAEKSENQIEETTKRKKIFNRQVDFGSTFFREKYGGRGQEEKISSYVTNLFKKLLKPEDGDIEVIVCSRFGDINALAFPNGKIFVSEELIDFCNSEDELLFVLGHELNHIRNKHTEKQHDLYDKKEDLIGAYQKGKILSRVHEYHADVKAFVDLNNQGINPYGAISFTQRMKKHNRFERYGITHGEDADRLVNLFWGTKLIDLDNLRAELGNPVPIEFHKEKKPLLRSESENYLDPILKEGSFFDDSKRHQLAVQRIKEMGLLESVEVAKPLYERRMSIQGRLTNKDISTSEKIRQLDREEKSRELFSNFLRKVENSVHTIDGIDLSSKDFAVGALLDLFYDIPVGADYVESRNDEHFDIPETTFSGVSTMADIEKVLRDTQHVAKSIGVYYSSKPKSFLLGLSETLRRSEDCVDGESFDFPKFKYYSEKIIGIVRKQYDEMGIVSLSDETIEECRALMYLQVVSELSDSEADIITRDIFSKHYNLRDKINAKRKLLGIEKIIDKEDEMRKLAFSESVNMVLDKGDGKMHIHDQIEADEKKRKEESQAKKIFFQNQKQEYFSKYESFHDMFLDSLKKINVDESDFSKRVQDRISVLSDVCDFIGFGPEEVVKKISIEDMNGVIRVAEDILTDLSKESIPKELEKNLWGELKPVMSRLLYENKNGGAVKMFMQEGFTTLLGLLEKVSLNKEIFFHNIYLLSYRGKLPTIKNEDDFYHAVDFVKKSFLETGKTKEYENADIEDEKIYETYLAHGVFSVLNSQIQDGKLTSYDEVFQKFIALSQKTKPEYTFRSNLPLSHGWEENDEKEMWMGMAEEKNIFFDNLFKMKTFSLESSEDLRQLLAVTGYVENPFVASASKKAIFKKILEEFSFEEGYDVVFQSETKTPLEVMELFLQRKAHTHSQIEKCHDEIFARYLNDTDGSEVMSNIIFSEVFFREMTPEGKLYLLDELLATQDNDTSLRKRILEAFFFAYREKNEENAKLELLNPEGVRKDLYRLSEEEKYLLLQRIFIGKNGVFEDDKTKFEFIDYFFKKHVDQTNENKEVIETLNVILKKIIEKCSPEQAFFAIQGLLRNRILVPGSNNEHGWDNAKKSVKWLYGGREDDVTEHEESDEDEDDEDVSAGNKKEEDLTWQEEIIEEIMDKMEREGSSSRTNLEDSMATIFQDEIQGNKVVSEKLSASELVVEIAKNLGSMGTRFLQLAGQYMDLPPELQEKFNQSYDEVSGQSKLTAYNTLKKNWKDFEQEVDIFGQEVGGGSMTSVYHTETPSQQKRVVKVLNPSFRYQLDEVYKILDAVFLDLSTTEPKKYGIASHMISDLMKWIEGDFDYENFLAEDKKFLKKWNGYRQKGNEYEILVPVSIGPESKKFKQEEEIEGKNLTKLEDLKAEGHDLKKIVSLAIDNFIAQIKDGQVHADIHIGNYRVTPDKKVAILDRNYFLQFDIKDRLFLWELFRKSGDPSGMAKTMSGYFSKLDENKKIVFDEIETELQESFTSVQGGNFMDILPKVLVTLRKHRVQIPLKITLLVKNINALKRMADTVGLDQGVTL